MSKTTDKRDYKRKGKKPQTKKNFDSKKEVESTSNDPSWYTLSGQLLHDVATLPFPQKSGNTVDLSHNGTIFSWPRSMPGICRIDLQPLGGAPTALSDPLNLAAAKAFADLRKVNSGSVNYSKASLMMYYLTMGSLYSIYAWLTRIYGVAMVYSPYNKFVPRALLVAMGVDPDDVTHNLANFRAAINLFANKLNYFATPQGLPYFDRCKMRYAGVYADEDDVKAQLYFFHPIHFYKYNEPGASDVSKVGTLTYDAPPKSGTTEGSVAVSTVADITAWIDSMILPLIQSQDFDIISGDIRKAYGDSLTVCHPISEDYMVMPVYDKRILSQIHNLNTVGSAANNLSGYTVYETFGQISEDLSETANHGALVCDTRIKWKAPNFTDNVVIDLESRTPSPEEVIEATRLTMLTHQEYDGTDYVGYIETCGMEVVDSFKYYYWVEDRATRTFSLYLWNTNTLSARYGGAYYGSLFKQAPMVYWAGEQSGQAGEASHNVSINGPWGDIQNWTIISKQTLKRMNEAATLSLFTVR